MVVRIKRSGKIKYLKSDVIGWLDGKDEGEIRNLGWFIVFGLNDWLYGKEEGEVSYLGFKCLIWVIKLMVILWIEIGSMGI